MLVEFSTKQIALISLFAAMIAVVTRLPGIPITIFRGTGNIELSVPLYPLAGILLGPFSGAIAVILGNLIAWLIPTSTMLGLLMIPAGAVSALVSGLLVNRVDWVNWKLAAIIVAVLDIMWYFTPVGFEAPFYPIPLHFSALAFILIFRTRIVDYVESPSRRLLSIGVALTAFIGTMAEHMTGNLIFISALGTVVNLKAVRDSIRALGMIWVKLGVPKISEGIGGFFMVFLPVTAVERIVFTLIAMVIGVAVIRILRRSNFK